MIDKKAPIIRAVAEYTANTVAAARVSLASTDPIAQSLHALVRESRAKLDALLDEVLAATQAGALQAVELPRGALPTLRTVVALLRENGRFEDEEGEPTDALEDLRDWLEQRLAATIDARAQYEETLTQGQRDYAAHDAWWTAINGDAYFDLTTRNQSAAAYAKGREHERAALASRSEAPEARPVARIKFVKVKSVPQVEWLADVDVHDGAYLVELPISKNELGGSPTPKK